MSAVLVTGASGHLGRALCAEFAGAGWDVLAGVRHAPSAPEGTRPVQLDLRSDAAIAAAADALLATTGDLALVANASNREALRAEDLTREAFHALLDVDLVGHAVLAQVLAERALAADRGATILFLGSIYGAGGVHEDVYPEGMAPSPAMYSATKAALAGLTRDLAVRWARHRIRVNCLAPGGIATGQHPDFIARYERLTPLGRLATPAEIAAVAGMLCAPAASYVTGQVIAADGGWTAW